MKKKKTRVLALCLSAILAVSTLAGCTGETEKTSSTGAGASSASSTAKADSSAAQTSSTAAAEAGEFALPIVEEPVTVTMWSTMDSNLTTLVDDYNETAFFKRLEEETNVHVEFKTPAVGNEATAYNLMIASNELPDMIRHLPSVQYPGGLDAAIDDGYFLDLTDLLPKYAPHYLEALKTRDETFQKSAVTSKGRYGSINQIMVSTQGPWCGLYVRQDWLEKLNMDPPKTYDDWETMLTAFKDEMGATAPLLLYKTGYDSSSNALSAGFGVTSSFFQEDGAVKFGPAEEGWREYVTTLHDWYQKGLIDPDFMSANTETGFLPDLAMVTTGKTGAFTGMYTNVAMWEESNTDPNAVYVPVPQPMKDENGTFDFLSVSIASTGMTISANSENAETCLKWCDYFFSEEGFIDCNYGVEGETFEYVDGKPKYNEFITDNDKLSFGQAMAFYTMPAGVPVWQDWTRETAAVPEKDLVSYDIWGAGTRDKSMPGVNSLGMTTEDNIEYSRIMADIQSIVDEKTAQFISGAASLDQYDAYLQQLEQMGIQDAIALVQKAYDDFLAREAG